MPAEVVPLIEKQGRLYIEKILSAITEAGFDLRAVPSVFMGGGAAIFKHRISEQDRLCRPIYLTDVHAKGNIKRFLIRQGIHHIKEIDYTVRSHYEAELQKMWDEANVMRYLKVFDHIKQYSIQKEIESLPGKIEYRRKLTTELYPR